MNILFIIFNRPEETREVFVAIKKAQPEKLFIAADGARSNRPKEAALCETTRAIVKEIDWPCQVETRFQDQNLGCKKHVSSAISWFFERVEEGVILEDDTVPDQSFFLFAQEMLAKYRDDARIMHISGTTFIPKSHASEPAASYHFSRYAHVWGWASWRRAWNKYDIDMKNIDGLGKDAAAFSRERDREYWIRFFKHMKDKQVDTWDAQWQYTIRSMRGLCITPNVNLVRNIGFGETATHTKTTANGMLPAEHMTHVAATSATHVDEKADAYLMDKVYIPTFFKKISTKIRHLLID